MGTYRPECKLCFSSNYEPLIKCQDFAIWRRVKRVPWDYTVTPEELIGEFSERLKQEASGILNWALPGLAGYVAVGKMVYPQKIVDATNQPRRNGDHRPVCKGASHPEAGCAGWGHRGSLGAAIEEICGVVREQLA